jgi:hypothetical protein
VAVLPLISVTAIVMIIAAVVSANSKAIMGSSAIVFVVVILHNVLGYALGFGLASLLHLPLAKKKALSIEVGMQNSGLAVSLGQDQFRRLSAGNRTGCCLQCLAQYFRSHSGQHLQPVRRRAEEGGGPREGNRSAQRVRFFSASMGLSQNRNAAVSFCRHTIEKSSVDNNSELFLSVL